MSATVLIAAPEHLPALKEREEFGGAVTFSDSDALRALDLITRQRPALVVLERLFASSSRGAALINRIKADPTLTSCEIRIVAHDSEYARTAPRAAGHAASPSTSGSTAVAEPSSLPAPPLDFRGTRIAPRFKMAGGLDVLVDGNPATLVDLSIVGAHVVSPTILRPNQRVRVTLPDAERPIRFSAGVAWAFFEMPKGGPRYRAGLQFFDADPDGLTRFIEANKGSQEREGR